MTKGHPPITTHYTLQMPIRTVVVTDSSSPLEQHWRVPEEYSSQILYVSEECMRYQKSQIQPDKYLKTPCHRTFVSIYEEMVRRRYCNTIIVTGPNGCGKTTSVRMLHMQLLDQGRNTAYIDVVRIKDHGQEYMRKILIELKRQGVETLMIDNAQSVELYPMMHKFEFVVAVFSPGARAIAKIPSFIKKRGDGNSTRVYFRPFCIDWCVKLLEELGCKVEKNGERNVSEGETEVSCDESNIPEEEKGDNVSSGDQEGGDIISSEANSLSVPLKKICYHHFMQLYYHTGGVPRYLEFCVQYGVKEAYKMMDEELEDQLQVLIHEFSSPTLCQKVKEFVLSLSVTWTNLLVMHGIGYVNKNNRGCIASPRYIHLVLQEQNLIKNDDVDWKNVTKLTLFLLRFDHVNVTNGVTKISLPRPTDQFCQNVIGDLPTFKKDSVWLMALPADHPVIDAMLVDCRMSPYKAYFVQTSFSRYSYHEAKRNNVKTVKIKDDETVYGYYESRIKFSTSILVYATLDFNHKYKESDIYFMDLRKNMQ